MIFGIGSDICKVNRFAIRDGAGVDRLPDKILTASEWKQWQERLVRHPARGQRFLATRFAAKEALSKALGLGMSAPMGWKSCEVRSNSEGRPEWVLHGDLLHWCSVRRLRLHLSLSDEDEYAIAYCIAEQAPVVQSEDGLSNLYD